jgi:hypothetical protein
MDPPLRRAERGEQAAHVGALADEREPDVTEQAIGTAPVQKKES